MPRAIQTIREWLGRVGLVFLALAAADVALQSLTNRQGWLLVIQVGLLITGVWLAIRLLRLAARNAVWRLRNRLLVTYLFIAVVPILLVLSLFVTGAFVLTQQLVVYLATSELDRRIQGLRTAAASIVATDAPSRGDVLERMAELFYRARYPGLEILVRQSGRVLRYPENGSLPPPKDGWKPVSGVLLRNHGYYVWAYDKTETGDVTVAAPLTHAFLAELVPSLGLVDFGETRPGGGRLSGVKESSPLPPAANRFDREITWFATVATWDWDRPGVESSGYLNVRSRSSAVLTTVFNRRSDFAQESLVVILFILVGVFFIVEIVSVVIGISMTRTITGAVHRLYEGTQRVIAGDFGNRIQEAGKDQLGELSTSFNRMTEQVQSLLVVAKEKERLQSEIEIAREVQNQLYPSVVPQSQRLRLTAVCQPARMVSGDYYDYESLRDTQVSLAIGDVAGKGISAALLMATLQSSLRTQLQMWLELTAPGLEGGAAIPPISTARVVRRMNSHLYSYTSPEKYATFCLGVYDEPTGVFTYTNAGHLPPALIRDGVASRLDVNGTVVGAFPFSVYEQSCVKLEPGDLLVFFSDGLTEPENEYGEMYGEERLIDLMTRNAHLSERQLIDLAISSVRDWTATEELQDDMTLLLARRV